MAVTVWVLGDQLNRRLGALGDVSDPHGVTVLLVESLAKIRSRPWHRQRLHVVLTSMRRFADELRAEGFTVDHRVARTLTDGLRAHVEQFRPAAVSVMEPASWDGQQLIERLSRSGLACPMRIVRSNQFLCHREEFARWADGRRQLRMEDFYRWQRQRLRVLMDGTEPCGHAWNHDHDNRSPMPKDAAAATTLVRSWPTPPVDTLDDIDTAVQSDIDTWCLDGAGLWGAPPDGTWATTRTGALARLDHFIHDVLPHFGPHEDAMTTRSWHLAHSVLSAYLNIGLLHPGEVVDAAEAAYRAGSVPIASAEGFIRQVIGWREYVWGVYWQGMPEYRHANELGANRPLPPVFHGAPTQMRCMAHTLAAVHDRAWTHHIQRLMLLGNLALLAGVDPWALTEWMWSSFVDGAEWVMLPNVIGMSQHADGGRMATKPYAAGGAYIDKMSDYCRGCAFDRTKRTGPNACPFTTLYWDFIDRHRDRWRRNHRMAQIVRSADRLDDLDTVRARAAEVIGLLEDGRL